MRLSCVLLRGLAAIAAVTAAVACGGGYSSQPVVSSVAGATAPPIQNQGTFNAAHAVVLSSPPAGASSIPVALPSAQVAGGGSFGGTVLLPIAANLPASATITEVISSASFGATPLLQGAFRTAAAERGALAAGATLPILYIEIASSQTVTFPSAPTFALTVPAAVILAHVAYYLAEYDPLRSSMGWQTGFEGPATINGSTLTFAAPVPAAAFTFTQQIPVYFTLYGVSSSAPAPTPAPNVTAAPAPTPFSLSTADLVLTATTTGTVTITDPSGYTGAYIVGSSAANVATVSASGTTITVTALAAGTATVTVSATNARLASFTVTVTSPVVTPTPTPTAPTSTRPISPSGCPGPHRPTPTSATSCCSTRPGAPAPNAPAPK